MRTPRNQAVQSEVAVIDPAWIALIGTILGGVGIKVAEAWLGRGRVKIDDATDLRKELRMDKAELRDVNSELRKEIDGLEDDVDKWREEYYNMRDKYVALQTELTLAINKLKDNEWKG